MGNKIIEEDIASIWSEIDLSPLAGKSVLITGASGLIGTYMIYSLLRWNNISSDKIQVALVIHRELPDHLRDLEQHPEIRCYRIETNRLNLILHKHPRLPVPCRMNDAIKDGQRFKKSIIR